MALRKTSTTSLCVCFIAIAILCCILQLSIKCYPYGECVNTGFRIPVQSFYVPASDKYNPHELSEAMATWNRTKSKSRYLQDRLQASFATVQYPVSCNGAKFFICNLGGLSSGYGSRMQHVVMCHIMAYSLGRILLLKDGRFEGYEDYVVPLESNTTCKRSEEQEVPLLSQTLWYGDFQFNNAPKTLTHHHYFLKRGLVPPFLPGTAPKRMADILETEGINPATWFIGQSTYFLAGRFQPSFVEELERFKEKAGLSYPTVGIHIRHSDKVNGTNPEAKFISALEYMTPVDKLFNERHPDVSVRNIFVATDDPDAIAILKKKFTAGYKFVGSPVTATETSRADHEGRYAPSLMRGIMTDVALLSTCDFVVCTLSSNVGRLIYGIRQALFADGRSLRNQLFSMDRPFYFQTAGDLNYRHPRLILVAKRDVKAHSNGTVEFGELTKGTWHEVDVKFEKQNDSMIWLGRINGYARREDMHALATRTELRDRQLLKEIDYLEQVA